MVAQPRLVLCEIRWPASPRALGGRVAGESLSEGKFGAWRQDLRLGRRGPYLLPDGTAFAHALRPQFSPDGRVGHSDLARSTHARPPAVPSRFPRRGTKRRGLLRHVYAPRLRTVPEMFPRIECFDLGVLLFRGDFSRLYNLSPGVTRSFSGMRLPQQIPAQGVLPGRKQSHPGSR